MTPTNDPIALLGKPSDAAEIQDLLRQAGAKDPRLKRGDVDAWLDLNDMGLALVFTDEAHLTGREDLAIGEGALILTSITFHSGDNPDYAAFTGALPFGVEFSQSRDDLVAKLGEPERSNPRRRQDRWLIDGTGCFAKHAEELDRMVFFGVQVPDPQ